MKYYLIAGEASGDLHGSNLMKSIQKEDPNAAFRFWGGDLMQAVGGTLVKHYKERSFMGFIEILFNLRKILGFIKFCKKDIALYQPDVVILIDNSGFNLPVAKWAKLQGFTTHYYISPQLWASREGRIKAIKAYVDYMYVVLPFVKDFYDKYEYPVQFVGHPLIDAIADHKQIMPEAFKEKHNLDDRPIIAILPGSRKQEIRKMLGIMLTAVDDFPEYQFVIAGAPSQDISFYTPFIKKEGVHLVMNETYDLLSLSNAALVTSGTATLETALFKVPQVVCYKGSYISYQIAKRIINLDYISLVNLIMDKPIVTELIQGDFNPKRLHEELTIILDDYKRAVMFLDYYDLEKKLGGRGASDKTAAFIVDSIK
ncbi:lipid-A-disaccharide synthase [Aquimarina gracilis]|uniref:Lipid-A-disaccharide synthase n=1 Tax=Aquimarina gracilis TaxID=874422 RepID=A0ABU5ZQ58_9FLAO|nr:lipid-A-disaccharide synthase [Aquimarina gracilis]MEB3344225.1 lipid-A-disaccharide synthase [Aquimarina gracilis]